MIFAVAVELGCRRIQRDDRILAKFVTRGLDRTADIIQRLVRRIDRRRETALVSHGRRVAGLGQKQFQRVKNLGAHAQTFTEVGSPNRHHHEFLNVERVVRMRPAIHDIHHRRRQQMRMHAAKIAPERHADRVGRGTRRRHRDTEDRVGT